MAISVKFKLWTIGPLVLHFPHHGCGVLLIERIARIIEDKPPVIFLVLLMPQDPHRGNNPFDPRFQPPAEFLLPAGLLVLFPHQLQQTLSKHPPPGISYPDWPYTREIVKANEARQHQRSVVRPGWGYIDQPVLKFPNNLP